MSARRRRPGPGGDTAAAGTEARDNVTILVVDDHRENLVALSALLEAPGRTLLTAASGSDALRALLRQEVAVILLDVDMPDMDGFEAAALIRRRPASAHTPIIFVTAHGEESHVVKAYSLGAVDYILAPVDPEVLRAKVHVFVELFRKTAENREQAERLRRAEERLRRQAEQELRETHARLERIIESVVDYAIYSLDAQGRVASWNAGAERLFRYEEGEAVGRDPRFLFPPDADARDLPAQQCGRAIAEGRSEIDSWLRRKDGTRFYATSLLTPMRDAAGHLVGFSAVTHDITERKRAEEAMQRKARELAEANRLKDEFLAVLSHELRTPLNAIIGWAHMLLDRSDDPAFVRRGLDSIARNGKAQLALVNDILDVSRFVTGKFRLDIGACDLRETIEAAVEAGQTAAHAKGIVLGATVPDRPVMVSGDTARLQQVTWNLVSNAVKFTPEGGSVTVNVEVSGRAALIRVRDNGVGIDADFLPYVFDRFRQADSSTARMSGGLGLGLAIVKHIVELHGGSVTAESGGKGHGATFTVILPLAGAGAAATPRQPIGEAAALSPEESAVMDMLPTAPIHGRPRPPLAGVTCLVVDDDPDTRELMKAALEAEGLEVLIAASAREGYELVARARVLVCDIAMPGEDGFSLMRKVRALPPDRGGSIPAIAVTAHAGEKDRALALEAGFQAHVGKPVDLLRVVDPIEEVLMAASARR